MTSPRQNSTYNFAQEDIDKYAAGRVPAATARGREQDHAARRRCNGRKEKLDWSERLFAEKYISNTELQADRLTQKSAS